MSSPTEYAQPMRVLFFLQPGTNSRRIFQDMIRGFERAGHEADILELAPIWRAYDEPGAEKAKLMSGVTARVREAIRQRGVDLTVGMWGNALTTFMNTLHEGVPRTVFDVIGVPHLLFWLDAPHWAQGGSGLPLFKTPILSGPMLTHLINNPATAAEMTSVLGFGRTVAEPYAIDEEIFRPVGNNSEAEFDIVVCVGPGDPTPTELALRELESDDPDVGALRREAAQRVKAELDTIASQARLADDAARDELRAGLAALLQSQIESRHVPVLDRLRAIAASGASGPAARGSAILLADPRLYVRATMVVRGVESWERPFTAAYLSRRVRCAVFGENNLASWGFRGESLGSPPHEGQSHTYARGRIGLNLMRWQDDAGLNLKPYEISASGVACLCVRRAWLDRSFVEGREIQTFDGPREALERARALLEDGSARAAIAAAGLQRTRSEHTWKRRAAEILTFIPARTNW